MQVVVYGRSDRTCMACRATKRALKRHGVVYEFHNVDTDPDAEAYARALGVLELPVVTWNDGDETGGFWSGYRPDEIKRLAPGNDAV